MSDTLADDDIAAMLAIAQMNSYTANGVKRTSLALGPVTMVLRELLEARAEIKRLKGEADARTKGPWELRGWKNSEGI